MQRIAIIGGGSSGLTSAVAVLQEGMIPTIFEKSLRIGGVWRPDDRDQSNSGLAWPGMKVNISRHTATFSNFEWPKNTEDYPTTQEVYNYLCSYARYFKLSPYIRLGCHVVNIYKRNKQWVVHYENEDMSKEEVFDAIIIASSKFSKPHFPPFTGLEKLKSKMSHSSEYKSADKYIGKTILVVGNSASGIAITEELAKTSNVIHLFRKPRWVIGRNRSSDPKINGAFLPRDLLKSLASSGKQLSPEEQFQLMFLHCGEQNKFSAWEIEEKTQVDAVVADDYFKHVRSGKIIPVRGNIDYFTDTAVFLKNGQCINFDSVIFCTGYDYDLSFLPKNLRILSPLYEDTFPSDTDGIAFIGMYPGARGAVFPLVELQAELASKVFKGIVKLPSFEAMKKEIAKTPTVRDEIEFSNALAKKAEVLPNFESCEPELRRVLYYGAFTPARFRLNGLHSDPILARKMIMETENYRIHLLKQKDKTPSVISLSIFQNQNVKKVNETQLLCSLRSKL